MKLTPTHIAGVVIVEPAVFSDDRGWFMETFNASGGQRREGATLSGSVIRSRLRLLRY